MKSIFFAILLTLAISNISYSQFRMTTSVGYGLKVNSRYDFELFQSSISVTPQYDIDKINVSAVIMAVNDSTAELFTGIKGGYQVWSEDTKRLVISASALKGFEGKTLFGGGVSYTVDNTFVSADAYQENENKEFWAMLSAGVYILR